MLYRLYILFFLMSIRFAEGQSPELLWGKTYGGSLQDQGRAMCILGDTLYFSGTTGSIDGDVSEFIGGGDIWLVKTDLLGNIIWENVYGGSDYDQPKDLIPMQDGGVMLIGNTRSDDFDITEFWGGYNDIWLIKIDESGNLEWGKTYGGSDSDDGASLVRGMDNSYYLVGSTASTDGLVSGHHGMTVNSDIWVYI
ncbi:MAG: hypothetical protein R2794_01060 [Chitinophagales bacterium]